MKYYYGNSMKEALSNSPVNIRGIKQYEQYKENYTILIPCDKASPASTRREK